MTTSPSSAGDHASAGPDLYSPNGSGPQEQQAFDPSRGDVVLSKEVFDFLMGTAPYDGTWFHELNDGLPGRFWWRAILRTAQRESAALTSGIEAAAAGETRSGSTEGESPAPEGGDAQPPASGVSHDH